MKKLVLVLAMALIALPASALTLGLVDNGDDTVSLTYNAAGDANRPRAFGLVVEVDAPAIITSVTPAFTGEGAGFGIFPGTIVIVDGNVTGNGTPVALAGDPGTAGTGLNTQKVVLEMGSLYVGESNAPATSGTLCTFAVDCSGATGDVTITVSEEDAYRGGIVFEDSSVPATPVTATIEYACAAPCDQPVAADTPTPANNAVGVSMYPTQPTLSWTPAAGGAGAKYDVYFGETLPGAPTASDLTVASYTLSGVVQGKTYVWKVVSKNDCNSVGVSSAVWTFNTYCLKTSDAAYNYWNFLGRPSCMCYRRQCRGDSNGAASNQKPVIASDFINFQSGYNLKYTQMIGKVDSYGVPSICADYTHSASNSKPVIAGDFTIFQTYYNLKITQGVTQCDGTNINFWTN